MPTKNESTIDRGVRVVLGVVLLGLTFTVLGGIWQIIAGIVGAILLLTGAVGVCPLYCLLGFSTCPLPPKSQR